MNLDLQLSAYDYQLDDSFIADRPEQRRSNAKLLVYNQQTDEVIHSHFSELANFLPPHSLMVFNNSKVFKARLLGNKESGAKVEAFVLSLLPDEQGTLPCLLKSARKKRVGEKLIFPEGLFSTIEQHLDDGTFRLRFSVTGESLVNYIERQGKIPIPPYIRSGESDKQDESDYQTIYAKTEGSVACPTAGLHFDQELMNKLAEREVETSYVTLHVGLGTFLPVKVDNLVDHHMHEEKYLVEAKELEKIRQAKFITAVGTTSLRVLETIYGQNIEPQKLYATDIFLHPGVEVKSINALVTNFHLPKSTLLMLVSSLIGREKTLELYEIAKEQRYRFFSYGDGMLILR